MTLWHLKKDSERRIRAGYPWVFASELAHSAKEIRAGELIELQDSRGHFVAYGYGHPSSQIAFRKLSANRKEADLLSVDFFIRRLRRAREMRRSSGFGDFSHRWLFAEADGVPGLIVDTFRLHESGWAIVVQASTAAMDQALPQVCEALSAFKGELGEFALINAPNSRARLKEGLKVADKQIWWGDLAALSQPMALFADDVQLRVDLLQGQKTGFFLDQQANIRLLKSLAPSTGSKLRVLDLCCYVGQWSAHLARAWGTGEFTLVDQSAGALLLAKQNVTAQGGGVQAWEMNVLRDWSQLEGGDFDVVVCDPPAFVKKKADLATGQAAYVRLNREAMARVRPGGLLVACSCSGLVGDEQWLDILRAAAAKAGRQFTVLAAAGHGPDHPWSPQFPEGKYLKCLIGRVEFPL